MTILNSNIQNSIKCFSENNGYRVILSHKNGGTVVKEFVAFDVTKEKAVEATRKMLEKFLSKK